MVAGIHPKLYLFNKDEDDPVWTYDTDDYVQNVAISSNGEYIVAGSYNTNDYNAEVYFFGRNSNTLV